MATERKREAAPAPGRVGAAVLERAELEREADGEQQLCTCCVPPNPLVMRPDLGTLPDGSTEYALCVLHEPEPVVYRNRGDGLFVAIPRLSLGPTGDLVDPDGGVVARVSGDQFQRLTTIDDDDAPPPGGDAPGGGGGPGDLPGDAASRPRTYHVDLTEDDFYGADRGRPG